MGGGRSIVNRSSPPRAVSKMEDVKERNLSEDETNKTHCANDGEEKYLSMPAKRKHYHHSQLTEIV